MTEAQSKVSNLCPHCLPDCNQIVYSSSASSAKFRFETRFLGFLGTFPFLSRCDSRNLNLSPLCGVSSTTSPLKLQPIVEATYKDYDAGNQRHIEELISPMRKEYPSQSMISNEIIPALTQVHLIIFRSAKTSCTTFDMFLRPFVPILLLLLLLPCHSVIPINLITPFTPNTPCHPRPPFRIQIQSRRPF